jgi:ribulose-bisphosphate carboxylase small chain
MQEIDACRKSFPERYVRVNAFDSTRGWETVRLSFIVNRPAEEARFRLRRIEAEGRVQRYCIEAA